jgi:hypothetical protein
MSLVEVISDHLGSPIGVIFGLRQGVLSASRRLLCGSGDLEAFGGVWGRLPYGWSRAFGRLSLIIDPFPITGMEGTLAIGYIAG